jgi:Ca-activated chloride channel family protein
MRLSPLAFAIALTLSACQSGVREDASQTTTDDGRTRDEIANVQAPVELDAEQAAMAAEAAADAAATATDAAAQAEGGRREEVAKLRAQRQDAKAVGFSEPMPVAVSPPPPPPAPMMAMRAPASGLVYGYNGPVAIPEQNTEHYEEIEDNPIHLAAEDPVSTFSIDVDTGSYSNVRRMLVSGVRPPMDAVRAEGMVN